MTDPAAKPKAKYATIAKARHAFLCAKEADASFELGGMELRPDGTIRVFSAKAVALGLPAADNGNDYDDWKKAGG